MLAIPSVRAPAPPRAVARRGPRATTSANDARSAVPRRRPRPGIFSPRTLVASSSAPPARPPPARSKSSSSVVRLDILCRDAPGVLQKIATTVTSAGFNIGTIATAPCETDPTLGHVTLALEDALYVPPFEVESLGDAASLRAAAAGEEAFADPMDSTIPPAAFNRSNVVPVASARDDKIRGLLSALPDVVEVTDLVEDAPTAAATATTTTATTKTATTTDASSSTSSKESRGGETGLLYLVHEFDSAPSWRLEPAFEALPLDPYLGGIGAGRFRAYSKFTYFFPGGRAAADAAMMKVAVAAADATFYAADAVDESPESAPPEQLAASDDVSKLTVKALKEELGKRSLPTDGLKAALVTRLREAVGGDGGGAPEPNPPSESQRAADGCGVLVEVPDPKFNPPAGYRFEGREDGQKTRTSDRRFVRVPKAMRDRPEFAEMIARFASYARLDPRYASRTSLTVGVHAIRIKADVNDPGLRGQVVPEGMHQDGFEYIGLLSPSRRNVASDWQTYVYAGGPNGERPSAKARPMFQNPVEPGCLLFLDDGRMWHDADDLRQADPECGPAWRDFIVVTLAADDNGGQGRWGRAR